MINIWQKIALASAGLGLTLNLTADPVQAALFNFTVSINSGPLDSQSFFGSLNFDESGLTKIGEEFLPVSQITFDFFCSNFTEADDLLGGPEVAFREGEFLGLSYGSENSQVSFSFDPGFFEVSEATFPMKSPLLVSKVSVT